MSEQDLFNFIWQIADLLRGTYRPPQYERVMLPMVVLRRFDCVLKATKGKVVAEYEKRRGGKLPDDALDALLNQKAGPKFRFHNRYPQTLEQLRGDPDNVHQHLVSYINGFSANVRKIFDFFDLPAEIEKMHESNILFLVVQKFCEVDLHPENLPNREMGKLFEHLIRKFNEQANETAGDHFTPREVIHLMVDLLFIDDDDILSLPGTVRKLLDSTCGTGGMLSEALNYVASHGFGSELHVFGQDYNKRSYAVAAADLLMKDHPNSEIAFGDSLTDDKFDQNHATTKGYFDYHLANPPFGVDWKRQKTDIENEHRKLGSAGRFGAGLPRINDGALLFLQHMIHKFEPNDPKNGKTGARLAIVFNGSPLFTGGAGSGESDIRKWIIENDWLEAIVALPEQMFFNTGIGTYIWIVTNRKIKERKGKIQLVDARDFYIPMRRSLGDKRRKIGEGPDEGEPDQIAEIVRAYGAFKEVEAAFISDSRGNAKSWLALTGGTRKPKPSSGETVDVRTISKVFDNEDFGHRRCTVERPLRLRYQMTTDRKSRFLEALPQLLDAVQAIDKAIGREPNDNWNSVQKQIEPVLDKIEAKWKKAEWKLFRDVFCETTPDAQRVIAESRRIKRDSPGRLYGWFPWADGKAEVKYEADSALRDAENIPLKEDEAEYFAREVQPFVPDAWIDPEKTKVGYEINFNRHFYSHKLPRPLRVVDTDLKEAEVEIRQLLDAVTKRRALITHAVTKDFHLKFDTYQRLRFEGDVNYPVVPLKYLSRITGGPTPNRGKREYWEGEIPWVSPKDMKVAQIEDSQEHITELGLAAASISLLPTRSLLIVVRGMILAHSLPVALNSVPVTINQDMRALTFDDCVLPEFALLYFQGFSSWLLTQVTESAHGTKKLDTQVIDELPIIMFPVEVQKSIIGRVERESNSIMTLEKRTLQTLELLRERRSALIAAAVSGQIELGVK